MKKLGGHIFSSFTATSVMTLFGYIYSFMSGNNVKEPVILDTLVRRLLPKQERGMKGLYGWCVHYAVGLLFTEMYVEFWKQVPKEKRLNAGLVFGAIGGLAAILIWKFSFAIHPNPPVLNFSRLAINLFIGHLLFGIVTALTIGHANK